MIGLLRRSRPDTYMLAMAGTVAVAVAAIVPARSMGKDVLDHVVHAAIAVFLFIYGARITPQAIRAGIMYWRLQALVLVTTFVAFPVIGLGTALA